MGQSPWVRGRRTIHAVGLWSGCYFHDPRVRPLLSCLLRFTSYGEQCCRMPIIMLYSLLDIASGTHRLHLLRQRQRG